MEPIENIENAIERVERFQGQPEAFLLPIADSLIDPIGLNMAVITDRILARKWQPDGFEQRDGYRIYKYKSWESVLRDRG
ncbi:MAG: hypothetical protein SWY16_22440 [Cyanobacteriota bacterium]|nr:hypothetical protein [Cyanobacteriota bacterium]